MCAATMDELDLLDWRRETAALYARLRAAGDPRAAWSWWRRTRERMFADHPQSPLTREQRSAFGGLLHHAYDPDFRVGAEIVRTEPRTLDIQTSTGAPYRFRRFATARFELAGADLELPLYWLEGYTGGVFLPFADASNGRVTYGGGRYLLDTAKGADLGAEDGRLLLDFNFAYNPSCAYNPAWSCPLAPPESRLPVAVAAGERAYAG